IEVFSSGTHFAMRARMISRSLLTTLACSLLVSCSSTTSPGRGPAVTPDDAGAFLPGADAEAGAMTIPTCDDPRSTPDMSCGSATWATATVKSRLRNHHLTFLSNTKSGPSLYVIGGGNANAMLPNADRLTLDANG